MRLGANDTICGANAKQLRDYLRKNDELTSDHVAEALSSSRSEAEVFLQKLLEEGYIEPELSFPNVELFRLTTKGNALAKAKFIAPMKRAKAEALLQQVIERAEEINRSPAFIHTVDKIQVFGSYLTDSTELGDLDLIVEDSFRSELGDQIEVTQDHAATSGRNFTNMFDALYYPRRQVEMKLRGRSPYIDIQEPDQVELLGLKPRLVFERSEDPAH